ncbi:acid protease [Obba rivulosa]|uniref:Acid protease n=1 Tax=Obba rivulosa TaxID=1052685 RepID=A0A8E2AQ14_9APHY|nr:acid protease [Obba rivulosa]
MLRSQLLQACLAASLLSSVLALSIPVRRKNIKRQSSPNSVNASRLSWSSPNLNLVTGFEDLSNIRYAGTIYLDGQQLEVILDTGSPDIWINTTGVTITDYTNTSTTAEIDYGTGDGLSSIQGPVLLTEATFADITVENQAFIYAISDGSTGPSPLGDPVDMVLNGLVGLGPPSEDSSIQDSLAQANSSVKGLTLLQNIFAQNPDLPQFFTFWIARNDGNETTGGGIFTIGEPSPNLAQILDAPRLNLSNATDHWEGHIDGVWINGQWYNTTQSGDHNLTAIFDSGTPTATVDPYFVDLMYKSIAYNQSDDGTYYVPCDAQVNVTFAFGDLPYPMHPIDMSELIDFNEDGPICVGSYSYLFNPTIPGAFVFGDSFLRNVYTLHHFNNWTQPGDSSPYTQLLSMTDPVAAAEEFDLLNDERISAFLEVALEGTYPSSASSTPTSSAVSSLSSAPTSASASSVPSVSATAASSSISLASSSASQAPSSIEPSSSPAAASSSTPSASSFVAPSVSSSLSAQSSAGPDADIAKVDGALAAASTTSSPSVDLSGLTRNTYIIMGLIGAALVLLIIIAALVAKSASATRGYKRVGSAINVEQHQPYTSEYRD